jgi:hypothetical protein
MPRVDWQKVPSSVEIGWITTSNSANNVAQFDLSFSPPQNPSITQNPLGIVVTCISFRITDSAVTTITLAFDGVDQMSWTVGATGGLTNSVPIVYSGTGLFATGANQTVRLRTAAAAGRTVSNVSMTGKLVLL